MPDPRTPVDLDDVSGMLAADPGLMLRATASAGAQVRRALAELDRDALAAVAGDGRPRSLVVVGVGGSGISGDVLVAVAGNGAPVPVLTHRAATLPGWVGALDLVVAVSCSGHTEETLHAATEAARRGTRLVGIGTAGTPLADIVADGAGMFLPVDAQGEMPRASLWTLATPLLALGAALGLAHVSDDELAAAADVLDEVASEVGIEVPVETNEAKVLALRLADGFPCVWGDSPIASVAAYRLACQLNENAKVPCTWGAIPEVAHNQVVAFDGRFGARDEEDDVFRDPELDGPAPARIQLVLVQDPEADPRDAQRRDLLRALATDRGMRPLTVVAPAGHAMTRLASLVARADWASVYAALALGEDPTPIAPITELKERLGTRTLEA